jgi:urate oxidase
MTKIVQQQYGKERVRVLRVHRSSETHQVFEFEGGVKLEGAFDEAYVSDSNATVVPTDTMKNTFHALAYRYAPQELEPFALAIAKHYLDSYAHVSAVHLHLTQKVWERLATASGPHPHTFRPGQGEIPLATVHATRAQTTLRSGVNNLLLLKTAGSGFSGYPKCGLTSLPETTDRILSTLASIEWLWAGHPSDFSKARATLMSEILGVFAREYSPSVQRTLYQMGEAALAAVPEISEITLALPNKHYLPINLTPFGDPEQKEVFLPTDEPHGQIEATLKRN